MFRKAIVALGSMCVLMATPGAAGAATDIVLYAADASQLHGNWSLTGDTTAAGGRALVSEDRGWASTASPLENPTDYFEFAFTAPAGTPYRVWFRMRAAANSKYNDSIFVQFSDALGP